MIVRSRLSRQVLLAIRRINYDTIGDSLPTSIALSSRPLDAIQLNAFGGSP